MRNWPFGCEMSSSRKCAEEIGALLVFLSTTWCCPNKFKEKKRFCEVQKSVKFTRSWKEKKILDENLDLVETRSSKASLTQKWPFRLILKVNFVQTRTYKDYPTPKTIQSHKVPWILSLDPIKNLQKLPSFLISLKY